MDLTTWMAKHDVYDETVADAVGCTRAYLNRIRNGGVSPSLEIALKIWDFTKYQIDIYQLLPKHARPPLKQPALPAKPRGRPQKPVARSTSKSRAAA